MNDKPARTGRWMGVAVVGVLIAVAAGLLLRGSCRPSPSGTTAGAGQDDIDRKLEGIGRRAMAAKTEEERRKILAESPRLLRGYLLAKASLLDVRLEGQVLDGEGKPLVGATVYYNTGGGLGGGASGNGTAVTDVQGRFVTNGKGTNLTIQSINKEGYRIPVSAQGALFVDGGGGYESWMKFSHDNPKVYRAWRVPSDMVVPETLVKSDFELGLHLDDRGAHTVELLGAHAVISAAPANYKPLPNADIQFELLVANSTEGAPGTSNWKLRATIVHGGGLVRVPADDLLVATAPQSGYEQVVDLTPESVGDHGQRAIETFWYVSFAGLHRYCRLRLELRPPRDRRDFDLFGVKGFAACNPLGQPYFFPYNGQADW